MSFTGDGTGVAAHAGSVGTRLLADRVGLTDQLSAAMTRRGFTPVHNRGRVLVDDRGRVLVDVAVLMADGGQAIADIDVLRQQDAVFGPVASPATVWRTWRRSPPQR